MPAVLKPVNITAAAAAGFINAQIVDASKSDISAEMMLIIPQLNGRDLDDLDIVQRDGAEWNPLRELHAPAARIGAAVAQGCNKGG